MVRMTIAVMITALFALSGNALAQKYPVETVRIIVPQLPGDACDTLARLSGHKTSERLGQPYVVDNHPGVAENLALSTIF